MSNKAASTSLANTFQPQNAGRLLTETYQPVGSAEIPKEIPVLVSGVAVPAAAVPPANSTQNSNQSSEK
jgi:hypothetical protein